jgi:hypothetical protein
MKDLRILIAIGATHCPKAACEGSRSGVLWGYVTNQVRNLQDRPCPVARGDRSLKGNATSLGAFDKHESKLMGLVAWLGADKHKSKRLLFGLPSHCPGPVTSKEPGRN